MLSLFSIFILNLQMVIPKMKSYSIYLNYLIVKFQNHKIIVAFTGYTGEAGCEIFVETEVVVPLWQALIEYGKALSIVPVGLGARDTLRTEKKYSLYGNEIDDQINPYAAGLGWVIKPLAKDFMGKKKILAAKEKGNLPALVGFKMKDKGIPRHGYELFNKNGEKIGIVTSGTHSPSLNEPIGIGYVPQEMAALGSQFFIDIRGRKVPVETVKTPFC